ncbi:XRE family transcriptional regulator [Reichenbachiella agarivorans]|uniref:XRE family transcriptional regulator n=1 Tax=Reichenbachiella agarivorans TaxID=2979464 RepID=A0ABY6CP12_9BACT|nr:XRE family transcriptional regulator [Reichenbachiella agarivorans]UXP32217.1 XRE family transcriptional regulator [Reichenbachiella agarivorans]
MDNIVVSWIGSKIKSIRNQKNLSLKELSNQSKISKGLLSKIENSRTIPSLPVFINILESLEVAPKDFFEDMYLKNGKNFTIVKKEDRKEIEKEDRQGFRYHSILNQSMLNLNVDIVHLTVEPHAKYEPTSTDGYEFKIVLSGKIEYIVGEDSTLLEEGDSIFFDARIPHYPKAGNEKVQLLVIYFLFP